MLPIDKDPNRKVSKSKSENGRDSRNVHGIPFREIIERANQPFTFTFHPIVAIVAKMAASNTPPTPNTGEESPARQAMNNLTQQLLHKPAFKRLAVIIVSFIPAFIALSIINVIFTHALVLSSYLFHSATPTDGGHTASERAEQKGKQKRVRTVYVPPSQDDLNQLLIDLESSEPLPDNKNDNDSIKKRAEAAAAAATAALESLMDQKNDKVKTSMKEVEELTEAYHSFVQRFDGDITHSHAKLGKGNAPVLEHIPQFMKRRSLFDLNRGALGDLFQNVIGDFDTLVRDAYLHNSNLALTELVNSMKSGSNAETSSSCDPIYLDLDKGNPAPELSITQSTTNTKKNDQRGTITEDTARESDLHEQIDVIKQLLSRRELSGNQNPINDADVEDIRAEISALVMTLIEKRQAALANEEKLKQKLLDETSLASAPTNGGNDTDEGMCASPTMVKKMVERGLDSIRNQADLQSTLITTVFNVVADEYEDEDFKKIMGALDKEMRIIEISRIHFTDDTDQRDLAPKSGKKKTLSFVVNGPFLYQGVAGSIDFVVEMVSGYNDYVDEFFDSIMSQQGASVGTATADSISNFFRKIPFPEVEKLRKAGILGVRIRKLVEE